MNALSSRRYTECVDRLNSVLGKLSTLLEQKIRHPYSDRRPQVKVVNLNANIVVCGRNTYRYSSNGRRECCVWIWRDGWVAVYDKHILRDEEDVMDLVENFEWEVQP